MSISCLSSGITIIRNVKYTLCHINYFSDEIKSAIRENLSKICYGSLKTSTSRITYNYQNTLREFLDRYEKKSPDTKKGMIGELLTHILLLTYFPEFHVVSPYFNLEEKSIKKGFDVVLFSIENKELWITEVKSGELHQGKNANETTKQLLNTAKKDLNKRLNENNNTIWENAINGAMIALDQKNDIKDAVLEILGINSDEATSINATSTDKNVILVSGLFSSLKDKVEEDTVKEISNAFSKEKIFRQIIIFSFQKNTFLKIVDFLIEERDKKI